MDNSYEVFSKVRDALTAVAEYERSKRGTTITPPWDDEIKKGLEELNEKRYMIGASGRPCTRCNGTGRE